MASAWIYQDDKQVKKHGTAKASWYVGWFDPDGKKRCQSCGPGAAGKSNAGKVRKRIESELVTGTYKSNAKKTWADFRAEYETKIADGMKPETRRLALQSLDRFERLIKPVRVAAVKTQTIDSYIAKRRQQRGKKSQSVLSKATINKDLRHLRAALRKAHKWGYLPSVPDFAFEKEAKKLLRYMTPEHFALIYGTCDKATLPSKLPYSSAAWWKGLLAMAYMTGWRISELLALRRSDVDLSGGFAITRAEDNKGGREERVKLHPVVVTHLAKLKGFSPTMFPWVEPERILYQQFASIQQAAGIELPCRGQHEHTPACHVYGFHDIRRAFATMNADRLTADALQALMRHKSYQTTQRYINMARQLDNAVEVLHVPDGLNDASTTA